MGSESARKAKVRMIDPVHEVRQAQSLVRPGGRRRRWFHDYSQEQPTAASALSRPHAVVASLCSTSAKPSASIPADVVRESSAQPLLEPVPAADGILGGAPTLRRCPPGRLLSSALRAAPSRRVLSMAWRSARPAGGSAAGLPDLHDERRRIGRARREMPERGRTGGVRSAPRTLPGTCSAPARGPWVSCGAFFPRRSWFLRSFLEIGGELVE